MSGSMLDFVEACAAAVPERAAAPARPMEGLVASPNTRAEDWQLAQQAPVSVRTGRRREAVSASDELDRILALPRRAPPGDRELAAMRDWVVREFRLPPRACRCRELRRPCITEPRPAQSWGLWELAQESGLLGSIGVGHGKTWLDVMAARAVKDCRLAVLLAPPGLLDQLAADYLAIREHWRVPTLVIDNQRGWTVPGAPVVHVLPYSKLSRPEASDRLERLAPDLIVLDEAHKVKCADTATTRRLMRYLHQHPECRVACWSGTLTSKSVSEYAHLADGALKERSPLPRHPDVVQEWALSIDPSDWQAPMGELVRLLEPGEHLYDGFRRRLHETRGVVHTRQGAVGAPIVMREFRVVVPPTVREAMRSIRADMRRPDGEELTEALAVRACVEQASCGFFYRWKFPRMEPPELVERWRDARKEWHKEVRDALKRPREHLDSPELLRRAAVRWWSGRDHATGEPAPCTCAPREERVTAHAFDCLADEPCVCPTELRRLHAAGCPGEPYRGDRPQWRAWSWPAWAAVKDLVQPEPDAVWLDEFYARACAEWAAKHRGVLWYAHAALGERVARLAGLPLHGGGPGAGDRIGAEDGSRSVVASIKAHGTGRDGLQRYYRTQLVMNVLSDGGAWEQLLGRLHRVGQEADDVECMVPRHCEEACDALDVALRRAKYVEGTTGNLQKLLAADVEWTL